MCSLPLDDGTDVNFVVEPSVHTRSRGNESAGYGAWLMTTGRVAGSPSRGSHAERPP